MLERRDSGLSDLLNSQDALGSYVLRMVGLLRPSKVVGQTFLSEFTYLHTIIQLTLTIDKSQIRFELRFYSVTDLLARFVVGG